MWEGTSGEEPPVIRRGYGGGRWSQMSGPFRLLDDSRTSRGGPESEWTRRVTG